MGLSVYLHVPFCLTKCAYCDFYSLATEPKALPEAGYVQAVQREWAQWAQRVESLGSQVVKTVFFGGGTPSLLSPAAIGALLEMLTASNSFAASAEISLEVNPKTANAKKLVGFQGAGVNRVSMGVQSLANPLLKTLGRGHDAQEALETLNAILAADFASFSVDLMYGLPHQSGQDLEATLQGLRSYPLPHLSAYELILEEHTPFYERYQAGVQPLPSSEKVIAQRRQVEAFAADQGLQPYEISNYAQAGEECRHNQAYWNYDSFIGLGPSAVSFLRWEELSAETRQQWPGGETVPYGLRWTNGRNLTNYLSGLTTVEWEWISPKTAMLEFVMMGLRQSKGIRYEDFEKKFSKPFPKSFQRSVQRAAEKGWMRLEDQSCALTDQGMLLSNEVLQEFL